MGQGNNYLQFYEHANGAQKEIYGATQGPEHDMEGYKAATSIVSGKVSGPSEPYVRTKLVQTIITIPDISRDV